MELIINPEFHSLIPPISKEEYDLLEENILSEGCREAIVTWNDCILDGHNRYEICTKHKIGFKVLEKEFDNEDEAKIWIIRNQLARRNLPPHERVRLALLLKPVIEEKAEKRMRTGKADPGLKLDEGRPAAILKVGDRTYVEDLKGRTDKKIAQIAGVGKDTVHKVEVIEKEAPPEIKEAARKGEISVNKAYTPDMDYNLVSQRTLWLLNLRWFLSLDKTVCDSESILAGYRLFLRVIGSLFLSYTSRNLKSFHTWKSLYSGNSYRRWNLGLIGRRWCSVYSRLGGSTRMRSEGWKRGVLSFS